MPGDDTRGDLGIVPWPWADNSVDEIHCAHYLDKQWRDQEVPPVPYTCDFNCRYGFTIEDWLRNESEEAKKFAIAHYLGAARELRVTLPKRPR